MNKFDKDNLTGKNHEGVRPNSPVQFLTAKSIIDDKVVNREGENMGSIKDIMIDVQKGSIEYIVIELGGFLGIGEKFFAIPFGVLKLDTNKEDFILDMDKETLENAPGFDKDHWPETNTHEFDDYWGSFMGNNTGAVPY